MLHCTFVQPASLQICRHKKHIKIFPKRKAYLCEHNDRCRASPADPRVANEVAKMHHGAPILLPLDGDTVPPDPKLIAMGQPPGAALAYALREVFLHVALPLLALWLFQRWLDHLEKRTKESADQSGAARGQSGTMLSPFRKIADLLPVAATAPSRAALVLLTATHVTRSIANIVQGLAERALLATGGPAPNELQHLLEQGRVGQLLHSFKAALIHLDQGLIVLYQVALVVFGCWALLSWKDVAINRFLIRSQETTQARHELGRIITPLNTFVTWALLAAAAVLVVQLLGVDVRPLLLVTGGSSIVAGLASQQLLTNAVSGMQMYLDRPFQVGDTISVLSGVVTYTGEVVEIAALRTHLALEDGSTVAIPNRALADMIIKNKSRSSRRLNRPPWYHSHGPLSLQLRIRLQPPDYGGALCSELEELRRQVIGSGAVEEDGPLAPRVELLGYLDRGVELIVRCRLRNPAKLASASAGGTLSAPASAALQLAGPTSKRGAQPHGGNGAGQPDDRLVGSLIRDAASSNSSVSGVCAPAQFGSRAISGTREDGLRLLRQQLMLALGPWLHLKNGTMFIE